jgi:hypothetical protein
MAGCAAAASGLVFDIGAIAAVRDAGRAELFSPDGLNGVDLAPALAAIALATVAMAPRLAAVRWVAGGRHIGWPVAVAGSLIATTTAIAGSPQPSSAENTVIQLALALAGALAAGGSLLACAETIGALRVITAGGLVAGVLVGPLAFTSGLHLAGWGSAPAAVLILLPAVIALVLTAAAARVERDAPLAAPGRGETGPAVVVGLLAVVLLIGVEIRRQITSALAGRPGTVSERRTVLAENFAQHYAPLAAGLATMLALAGYAHRRGGLAHSRWVLIGAGLAFVAPAGLEIAAPADGLLGPVVVAAGLAACVVGMLAAWYGVRRLPWDAFGLATAGIGLLLLDRNLRHEFHSPAVMQSLLITCGVGLALGYGLTRLVSADPARLPGSSSLGFAAMLLGGWALGPVTLEPLTYREDVATASTGPILAVGIAAILVLWHVLDRFRSNLISQIERAVVARIGAAAPMKPVGIGPVSACQQTALPTQAHQRPAGASGTGTLVS